VSTVSLPGTHINVPTLALCGGDDLRAELMMDKAQYLSGEYRALTSLPARGIACTGRSRRR